MSQRLPVVLLAAVTSLLAEDALAAPRSRDLAKALVAELEKTPAAQGAAKDALSEARRAIVRAERARLALDHHHGSQLEDLALEWAEAARDLKRTAEAATRAGELERKLREVEMKLDRARTLIEQTNGRRARAEAQLKELETPPTTPALPAGKPATTQRPSPTTPPARSSPAAPPSTATPAPTSGPAPGAAPAPRSPAPPRSTPTPAPISPPAPAPAPTPKGSAR